jgi:hypothetical protein
MSLTYVAAIANIGLLIALLYPAVHNYSKTRSSIALALLVFVLLFLVQNIVAIYYHLTLMYTPSVEIEIAVLTVLQTISFATFVWASYK